jgi:hypothetical protein
VISTAIRIKRVTSTCHGGLTAFRRLFLHFVRFFLAIRMASMSVSGRKYDHKRQ